MASLLLLLCSGRNSGSVRHGTYSIFPRFPTFMCGIFNLLASKAANSGAMLILAALATDAIHVIFTTRCPRGHVSRAPTV